MIYAIIPARFASTRFPGKPLVKIAGKPMIQRVYEQVSKASLIEEVCVATDNRDIYDTVAQFGGNVVMTADTHLSGTDRLAEVVKKNDKITIAVNIQGDEPLISPECIDLSVKPLLDNPEIEMATLIRKACKEDDLHNPNAVKVVIDKEGYALYFCRNCVPYIRNEGKADHFFHLGIYAYRRETLLHLSSLEPSPIELSESLEQLRALYNGIRIKTSLTTYCPIGVDTPEDLQKAEKFIQAQAVSS